MSWAEKILDRGAESAICMELLLDTGTLYFSDTYVAEDDKNWIPYIKSLSSIPRAVDPTSQQALVSDITITLKNELNSDGESWFKALEETTIVENRVVNVYLKFKESDGSYSSEQLYSGLASPQAVLRDSIPIKVKARLQAQLPLLQRQVNTTDHPNAPEESIGKALPFVLSKGVGINGMTEGIMVDDTTSAQEIAFASHECVSIPNVWRERGGVITGLLTTPTQYTTRLFQFDESGNNYASIVLTAAAGHQDGDKYYAEVYGLCSERHYITLNGSSQYCWLGNHADFNLNDTISVMCRFRADSLSGLQILEGKTSATTGARLALFDDEVRWYIGGESQYIQTDAANLQVDTWYIVAGTFDSDGSLQQIFVVLAQGLVAVTGLQTTTRTGPVPTEIGTNTQQLRIGADRTAGNKFDGDVDLVIVTEQVIGSGAELSPKNTQGYWHFAGDLTDNSGNGHTLTSVGSPAFTPCFILQNPVCVLEAMFTNRSGWGMPFEDLDSASWDAARALATARGYDTNLYFGGSIGLSAGQLQSKGAQWELAQKVANNFDHNLYMTLEGKIGITSIDVATLSSSSDLVVYDQNNGDFSKNVDLKENRKPWKRLNVVRALFRFSQGKTGFQVYLGGSNQLSIDNYELLEDTSWQYQFISNVAMAKDVLGRQLTLRSGKTKKLTWTTPGLFGLQAGSDIGDIVVLKTDGYFGANMVTGKQVVIVSVNPDLINRTVQLGALTIGDTIGSIAFDGDITSSLVSFVDTSVKEDDPNSSFGSDATLVYGDDPGGAGTNQRCAIRFDLSSLAGSATVKSATLRMTIRSFDDPAALVIRQLNSTAWSESSTYNNFDGSAWTDALILGTDLSDTILPSFSAVDRTFTFNAAGLAYLEAQIGSDVEFTFFEKVASAPFSWGLNSSENDPAPELTIVHI